MSATLRILVAGTPKTSGSKKFVGRTKTGRGILVDDSGKPGEDWRRQVAQVAALRRDEAGWQLCRGAVRLDVTFYRARPKSHFTATGAPRKSAPTWPTTRPDRDKLSRSISDSITGVLIADDAQIVAGELRKVWGDWDGCEMVLTRLEEG
jgi:Holliday junction resolvase RusA-like endonuclease